MTWPTKNDFVDGDVLTAAQVNNIANNLNEFDPTSATSGQVWVADGAGSGAYGSAGGGMTLIQSVSLTSGTRHTVSSIPGSYQSLYIRLANCTVSGGPAGVGIEINGLTNQYRFGYNLANSTPAVTADAWNTTYISSDYTSFPMGWNDVSTTVRKQAYAWIHNYAQTSTAYKTMESADTGYNGTIYRISQVLGFNRSATADGAITSVAIYANGATFTGGTFEVYGVK